MGFNITRRKDLPEEYELLMYLKTIPGAHDMWTDIDGGWSKLHNDFDITEIFCEVQDERGLKSWDGRLAYCKNDGRDCGFYEVNGRTYMVWLDKGSRDDIQSCVGIRVFSPSGQKIIGELLQKCRELSTK